MRHYRYHIVVAFEMRHHMNVVLKPVAKSSFNPIAIIVFWGIILCCSSGFAQLNDSIHHQLRLTTTGNYNRTNDTRQFLFNNSILFRLERKETSLNANGKWVYGRNTTAVTNNDFTSGLEFNLNKTFPNFYYWGFANFTSSYSLRVRQQWQSGVGIAYRIWNNKNIMLSISDGILYEYSHINKEATAPAIYETYRNSLRINCRVKLPPILSFNVMGYYQPSLSIKDDYIISCTSGIDVKLLKWLSCNASFSYNKITRTRRENMIISYGLVVEKFF